MKLNIKAIGNYYRNLPKNEWKEMRKSVSTAEYILWWQLRVMMIVATLLVYKEYLVTGERFDIIIQLLANTAAAFCVTLLRVIFPKQIFLGRVPYSAQKYGMIIIFFGSFCGHYLDYCAKRGYDTFLHILSGFLCVFICYEIVSKGMQKPEKPISGFISSVIGFGMGCFVIIVWEVFEFAFDYYTGSFLQDYEFQPAADYMFFRLFGTPVNATQYPVLDTMIDMVVAVLASVPAAAVLWAVTAHKQNKEAAASAIQVLESPQIEITGGDEICSTLTDRAECLSSSKSKTN